MEGNIRLHVLGQSSSSYLLCVSSLCIFLSRIFTEVIDRTICAFLIVTLFLTPSRESPFSQLKTGVPPYVIPTIGLSTLIMGYVYYLVFTKLVPKIKKKDLIVEKDPIIVRQGGKQNGAWVLFMEGIDFWWAARSPDTNRA